jgi:AAA domain-containing protein
MATEKNPISLSDFEAGLFELDGASEHKNLLIHGDSGAGKTVLAGTVPGRSLFLAGEPGYISAARLGAKGTARVIPDTATADAAIRWLEDGNFVKFDWVVIDGASTMNKKFLLGYAAEAFDANPAKRAHRNLPDKPDYFNAQNFMMGWIARFVDLPVNVLITAHSMRPDGEDGETLVYPGIQGKGTEISNYISGLMHTVGYMSIRVDAEGNEVRRVLWQHTYDKRTDTRYFAKDQFNRLPRYTDNLTMPEIIEILDSEPTPAPKTTLARKRRGSK